MVYKEHIIELFVNGKRLELESQKSLNLRFNNVLYDPEKITSSQADYSFEFEIPATPYNNSIFGFANELSQLNKFRRRLSAEVYADGDIIFQGSLTLNGYKKGKYQCNLVSVKVYSFEDIFDDAKLTDIPWDIPFDGAGETGNSINYYNELSGSTVVFPFISYGAFQKSPYHEDDVAKDYSSKFILDKYNRWYVESFAPSLQMLELIRKAFEYKGYSVGGDAFRNVNLQNIFMSCNLADEQSPIYNLGNPKFGKVSLHCTWTNPLDLSETAQYGISQDLKYPYFQANEIWVDNSTDPPEYHGEDEIKYNFTSIRAYDMMSASDGGSVTVDSPTYLYQPDEHLIVIPADGFYKITLNYSARLLTTDRLTAKQHVHYISGIPVEFSNDTVERDISFWPDLAITTPLEIQLVRNYDENIELIKGRNNIRIIDGFPDDETVANIGTTSNYINYKACFPHEPYGKQGYYYYMTKWNDLQHKYTDNIGYVNAYNDLMCYDPAVSDIFIAGATSMGSKQGNGTGAVIKNGYSWSKSYANKNNALYVQSGYYNLTEDSSHNPTSAQTDYNKNTYPEAIESFHNQLMDRMNGTVVCMVELKKNDVIQLFGVHREYEKTDGTPVTYQTSATVDLTIEAASPKQYYEVRNEGFGYRSNSEFNYNLKVTDFLNNETKISDWLSSVVDAFNLEVIQEGKSVFLNSKKKFGQDFVSAVNIDDRVNSADAESSRINYPKSMAVKYKIDTDEWGFERSAVEANGGDESVLNDPDWKKYGDSGYSVINLSDDTYETGKSEKSLKFSYTWYDNFTWTPVNSSFQPIENSSNINLRIPVISKFSYMIDGYDYDESMKHDGFGLAQRFWFRPSRTDAYIWTRTYPVEKVQLYTTKNDNNVINLSYKVTEPSLLTSYFNITPYLASNYVTVEAYLTPEEYNLIRDGAMVHFDSDLYFVTEITGYDPTGNNPTELKMIKKV